MHFVYILYSPGRDRFYVGESADPDQRLAHHRAGHAVYTRQASDWVRVFLLSVPTQTDAKIVERRIKRFKSRARFSTGFEDLTIRWEHLFGNTSTSHNSGSDRIPG